jgi:hypothetical protein
MSNSNKSTQPKILFVSHKEKQCGIYQYGVNIGEILKNSSKYSFSYEECSSAEELLNISKVLNPSVIIYNYHPPTLPWVNKKIINEIKVPHIGTIHEITQQVADFANNDLFDYHITPDPTLLLKNPIVFRTGRLIRSYSNTHTMPEVPTIGSFGFGYSGKGFELLVKTVQEEYDRAVIRLQIPFSPFMDSKGNQALAIAQRCKDLLVKPEIKLIVNHDFLTQEQLLDFLAQNTLNAFFYESNEGRGISSVIDYALMVQRPIAITRSSMFRHLFSATPSICIEDSNLRQIIDNGIAPLQMFYNEWSEANLIYDYEIIVEQVLNNYALYQGSRSLKANIKKSAQKILINLLDFNLLTNRLLKKLIKRLNPPLAQNQWVQQSLTNQKLKYFAVNGKKHLLVDISNVTSFNRILDNSARDQYRPTIALLFALTPELMYQKIPEANVQQAFVFDTVQKFARKLPSAKILCVGSYEDTASIGLRSIGTNIEEIDPSLNYDLGQFFNRPSTIKGSYNIIFSTSVLEHVENDELFIRQIAELLAPGGVAIITCDYNDQYKLGDPIPSVDYRFYTQRDFKERLLPSAINCLLVDTPNWDCPDPDFTLADIYCYTFATLVFQKQKL